MLMNDCVLAIIILANISPKVKDNGKFSLLFYYIEEMIVPSSSSLHNDSEDKVPEVSFKTKPPMVLWRQQNPGLVAGFSASPVLS